MLPKPQPGLCLHLMYNIWQNGYCQLLFQMIFDIGTFCKVFPDPLISLNERILKYIRIIEQAFFCCLEWPESFSE